MRISRTYFFCITSSLIHNNQTLCSRPHIFWKMQEIEFRQQVPCRRLQVSGGGRRSVLFWQVRTKHTSLPHNREHVSTFPSLQAEKGTNCFTNKIKEKTLQLMISPNGIFIFKWQWYIKKHRVRVCIILLKLYNSVSCNWVLILTLL